MNKYETGTYLVLLFDKYGTQQDAHHAHTYKAASQIGDEAVKKPPIASYTIIRTIYNSIDNKYPWS